MKNNSFLVIKKQDDFYCAYDFSRQNELPIDWVSVNQIDSIAQRYVEHLGLTYNVWHSWRGKIKTYPMNALVFARKLQARNKRRQNG
jgi:hypothetical protein